MKKTLKIAALTLVLGLTAWGACHAGQIRKMHRKAGRPCIPQVNCPVGS